MAFIETRFRRCCSFRSRRAIGGGSVRRRRSLARSWRGSTRVTHGDASGRLRVARWRARWSGGWAVCGAGVFAAGESPNAFYGHCGGSGAGGQVPDCCGLGRALHRCWRYQRSAPAQVRNALWPVLVGSVSTGGRGRAPGWIWPSGAQPVTRKLSLPPLGG